MKYSRWLSMLVAVAVCIFLAAPMNADAASKSSSAKKLSREDSVRKHSSGTASARKPSREKSGKKSSSRDAKKSARSAKSSRSVEEVRQSVDSREIWLKRAQDSEIMTGKASWYGTDAHGGPTASGIHYDMYTFTAAHRTLPMGTVVRVTDQENGKSVMVCVTDRGPFVRGRIIDLSYAAAQQLDLGSRGISKVELEVVSDEGGTPLRADQAYYVHYNAAMGGEKIGPFRAFADAAAMHEALRQAHPEAEVVMDRSR